jgi:hypothetical protein
VAAATATTTTTTTTTTTIKKTKRNLTNKQQGYLAGMGVVLLRARGDRDARNELQFKPENNRIQIPTLSRFKDRLESFYEDKK